MDKIPPKFNAGESKGGGDKPPQPVGRHLHRVVVQQPATKQSAHSASSMPPPKEEDTSGTNLGKRKRELEASSTGHKVGKHEGEHETPVLRPASEDFEALLAARAGETARQRCDRVFASALASSSPEDLDAIGLALARKLGGPSADAAVRSGAVEALVLAMQYLPEDRHQAHVSWVNLAEGMGRGFSADGEPIAPAFFKLLLKKAYVTSTFANGDELARWEHAALGHVGVLPDRLFEVMKGTALDGQGLQLMLDVVFPTSGLPDGDRRKDFDMRLHATWAGYFFSAAFAESQPQERAIQALRHLIMTAGDYRPEVGMHHYFALFSAPMFDSEPSVTLRQILAHHEHLQDVGCAAWALAAVFAPDEPSHSDLDVGTGRGMSLSGLDPMELVTYLRDHSDELTVDQEVRLIEGLLWLRGRTTPDVDEEGSPVDFDAPMRAAISHVADRCTPAQLMKLALRYAKATQLAEAAGAQESAIDGMLPPVPEVETKTGSERRVQRTAELRLAIEAGFGLRGKSPLKAASIAGLSDPEKLDLIRTGYEIESFGAEQVREHIDTIAHLDVGAATRSHVYSTVFDRYPEVLNARHLGVARTLILDHILDLAHEGSASAPDSKLSWEPGARLADAMHPLEEVYDAFQTGSGLDFAVQQKPPALAAVQRHRAELTAYAGVLRREIDALDRAYVPELVRQTFVDQRLRVDLARIERALQTPEPGSLDDDEMDATPLPSSSSSSSSS